MLGVQRFQREIAVVSTLQHAHILPLYDSGEVQGPGGAPLLFYVMPYVAGESLRSKLAREHQLPLEDALALARDVAGALDYAHRKGVVHRDIKPENILLSEHQAIVADFGIARAFDSTGDVRLTETGMSIGTPAYMSPEQGTGGDIDGRSDIYSLGCVLYEMLAGEPPYTGRDGAGPHCEAPVDTGSAPSYPARGDAAAHRARGAEGSRQGARRPFRHRCTVSGGAGAGPTRRRWRHRRQRRDAGPSGRATECGSPARAS